MSGNVDPSLQQSNTYDQPVFNPYAAELGPDDVETLRHRTDIHLYFAPHTYGPLENDSLAKVVENLDPATSLAVFEGINHTPDANALQYRDGSPDTEPVRQARQTAGAEAAKLLEMARVHRQNTAINCFGLARRIAQSRAVPVVFGDFNTDDLGAWTEATAEGAQDLPPKSASVQAFLQNEAVHMDFAAATAAYKDVLANCNARIPGRLGGEKRMYYRWGEMSEQRERVAVNMTGHVAIEQLSARPLPDGQALAVHDFYGLEHRGIEARFRELGVPVTVHVMGSDGQFREATEPFTAADRDAYRFAEASLWYETNNGHALGLGANMNRVIFSTSIREIPLPALIDLYERQRARVQALQAAPETEATQAAYKQIAGQLANELRTVWQRAIQQRQQPG